MILGASELILLNSDPIENVKKLHAIADGVEIMLDGDCWSDENDKWRTTADQISKLGCELTVHPPAWDCNITAGVYSLRETALRLNISALEVCRIVGAKQMVFHPGYCDRVSLFSCEKAKQHSREALERLIPIAKEYGITLAVENIAGPGSALYTQEEYCHLLDGVDETAQYLIDIGHANFNGWDIPMLIHSISPRLCGLHIHDNNGRVDQHLPIGHGSVPWEKCFREMERLSPDCHFILEYAPGTSLQLLIDGVKLLKDIFN